MDLYWNLSMIKHFNIAKTFCPNRLPRHYDLYKETRLMTYASGTGLGFIFQQSNGDDWSVIQAGSPFLTIDLTVDTPLSKKNCLASYEQKRNVTSFLAGLPHFDVLTDHNPPLSIFNSKRLDSIKNPKLQRLKMKIVSYNFTGQRVVDYGTRCFVALSTEEAKLLTK